MQIKKRVLSKLKRVYAVSSIEISGTTHLLAATENKGDCLLFSPPDWLSTNVWKEPGGTMHISPFINSGSISFFAIQKFYPVFQSENACIVFVEFLGCKNLKKWKVKKIMDLPFVHRICIINSFQVQYLIASTLCGRKESLDDWTKPGTTYYCKIPQNIEGKWSLKPILDGISKNHGMQLTMVNNKEVILISGSEGVFIIHVPDSYEKSWKHECLISKEVSDAFLYDIDEDGAKEISTIEPFHGDNMVIYKQSGKQYKPIFNYNINFGHVISGGRFLGKPGLIIGNRGGKKDLILLRLKKYNPITMDKIVIDEGGGPTQITIIKDTEENLILGSANNETGEVVLYSLFK